MNDAARLLVTGQGRLGSGVPGSLSPTEPKSEICGGAPGGM